MDVGYGGEEVFDGGLKRFRKRAFSLESSVFIGAKLVWVPVSFTAGLQSKQSSSTFQITFDFMFNESHPSCSNLPAFSRAFAGNLVWEFQMLSSS